MGIDERWMLTIISSLALLLLLAVALAGAAFFLRLYLFIFIALMFSIAAGFISLVAGKSDAPGYSAPSLHQLGRSVGFAFAPDADGTPMNYLAVYSIIFPAVTGIMAGANYSGDLKDPGRSIGRGTLAAIAFSMVIYLFLIFAFAATTTREELLGNVHLMQTVCFAPWLIVVGLVASTISSALGALNGSARVLQALARDDLLPVLRPFAYGSRSGDEPRVAVLFSWLIAQCFLLIGNLNTVAALISNFFMLVYFFVNFACFVLRVSGAPNFRPRFRYFSWHTALLGALLSAGVMFAADPIYASLSIILVAALAVYVHYKAPITSWGDVTQALIFHQARAAGAAGRGVTSTHPPPPPRAALRALNCRARSASTSCASTRASSTPSTGAPRCCCWCSGRGRRSRSSISATTSRRAASTSSAPSSAATWPPRARPARCCRRSGAISSGSPR